MNSTYTSSIPRFKRGRTSLNFFPTTSIEFPGAIQIAGGIVLFLIGLRIIFRSDEVEQEPEVDPDRKAMELALDLLRIKGNPYANAFN